MTLVTFRDIEKIVNRCSPISLTYHAHVHCLNSLFIVLDALKVTSVSLET